MKLESNIVVSENVIELMNIFHTTIDATKGFRPIKAQSSSEIFSTRFYISIGAKSDVSPKYSISL